MTVNITALEYQRGMLDKLSDVSSLPVKRLVGSEIPKDLIKLIRKNKMFDLPGTYGDPAVGDPIEYHHLKIFHDHGVTEIRYFNLAIAMFTGNDEATQRIFRVMAKLMQMK